MKQFSWFLQNRSVNMSIKFPKLGKGDAVLPGKSTPIQVSVEAKSAEVTVIVVDKAILELVPHNLRDLAADFMLDLAMRFSTASTADFLVNPKAVSTLIDNFVARFGVNPWADLVTDVSEEANRTLGTISMQVLRTSLVESDMPQTGSLHIRLEILLQEHDPSKEQTTFCSMIIVPDNMSSLPSTNLQKSMVL